MSHIQIKQHLAVNAYYKKQLQDGYEASYFTDDEHTKVSDAGKQALLDSGVKQDDLDRMTEKELADSINSLISKNVAKDLKSDEYQQKDYRWYRERYCQCRR